MSRVDIAELADLVGGLDSPGLSPGLAPSRVPSMSMGPVIPPSPGRDAQVQPGAAADAHPLGASLLHFASVLARLPRLPESTAALPAKGTVQREHLESAIDWCFQQIQLL